VTCCPLWLANVLPIHLVCVGQCASRIKGCPPLDREILSSRFIPLCLLLPSFHLYFKPSVMLASCLRRGGRIASTASTDALRNAATLRRSASIASTASTYALRNAATLRRSYATTKTSDDGSSKSSSEVVVSQLLLCTSNLIVVLPRG
jgi:hypothetical protein